MRPPTGRETACVCCLLVVVSIGLVGAGSPATALSTCTPGDVHVVEERQGEWWAFRGSLDGCTNHIVRQDSTWEADDRRLVATPNGSASTYDLESTDEGWLTVDQHGVAYRLTANASNATAVRSFPFELETSTTSVARDRSEHYWVGTYSEGVHVFGNGNETVLQVPGAWSVDGLEPGIALVKRQSSDDDVRLYEVPADWNGEQTSLRMESVSLDPVVDHPSSVEARPGGGYVVATLYGNVFVYDEDWRLMAVHHANDPVTSGLFWLAPPIVLALAGLGVAARWGEEHLLFPLAGFLVSVALAVLFREALLPDSLLVLYSLPNPAIAAGLAAIPVAIASFVHEYGGAELDVHLAARYAILATPLLLVASDFVRDGYVWL